MKSVANDNTHTGSRIPMISGNTSLHKPTLSESNFKEPPRHIAKKLSLNMTSIQSAKLKPPSTQLLTTKQGSAMLSSKNLTEYLSPKELPKTTKSTVKRFELRTSKSLRITENYSRIRWEEIKTPLTSEEVTKRFPDALPKWEQEEMKTYPEIYYIGKNFKPKEPDIDDENGDFNVLIKDHIAFRYEIVALIGKGSFGQVLEVYDHKEKKSIALKVIKNKPRFNQQAKIEVEILEVIKDFDQQRESNIIEIIDKFIFRKHMVRYI